MVKVSVLTFALVSLLSACAVNAQEAASTRAGSMAAALDKTKYKKKEKRDFTVEIYVEIRNAPAVLPVASYSGRYVCETGSSWMEIAASADGRFTATGEDDIDLHGNEHGRFTISDGRIDGAVLAGTRVFDNGERQPFEAVFVNRTIKNGRNANEITSNETSFGLGYVRTNGEWTNRLFLERK